MASQPASSSSGSRLMRMIVSSPRPVISQTVLLETRVKEGKGVPRDERRINETLICRMQQAFRAFYIPLSFFTTSSTAAVPPYYSLSFVRPSVSSLP